MAQPSWNRPCDPDTGADAVWPGAVGFVLLPIILALAGCGGDAPSASESPSDTGVVDTADAADVGPEVTTDLSADADGTDGDAGEAPDAGDTNDAPEDQDATDLDETDEAVDQGPLPCDPALALHISPAFVLPFGLAASRPSGGTGDYRFTLSDDRSGALLNGLTGSYLAGAVEGVSDTITLTDEGCVGSATSTIDVVTPGTVLPLEAEVLPDTTFTFEVSGGSGAWSFELAVDRSGATLDAVGAYRAGSSDGPDVIRVTDDHTGEQLDALITVDSGASLAFDPPVIGIPLEADFQPRPVGGSGHLESLTETDVVGFDGLRFTGLKPGRVTLDLRDRFSGQQASLDVFVAAPLPFDLPRTGDRTDSTEVRGGVDWNGDGFPDAVLAHGEADLFGSNAGAVFFYAGTGADLAAAPVAVVAGARRDDHFGRGLALGDVNGDGRVDMAVGAPFRDAAGSNSGHVTVFSASDDSPFPSQAIAELSGLFGGDELGQEVVLCDVNGDGLDDLIASAPRAEDREIDVRADDQGAILVFLSRSGELSDPPDQVLYGVLPDDENVLVAAAGDRVGTALAGGDVDGDGLCDVIAGARRYSAPGGNAENGAVVVYPGRPQSDDSLGGIEETPALVLLSTDPDDVASHFGDWVGAGHLDGDERAEILVGQPRHTEVAGVDRRNGALRVFSGREFAAEVEVLEAGDADWSFVDTDETYNYSGWRAAVVDSDGDGDNDLVISSLQDEVVEGTRNVGSLRVFHSDGGLPAATPSLEYVGLQAVGWFGHAFAPLGDLDGDDVVDYLVHATTDDTIGYEVGQPYFLGSADGIAQPLQFPGPASSSWFGRQARFVGDVDGDEVRDLVVGAPLADVNTAGLNNGEAFVYSGAGLATGDAPITRLGGFFRHSGSDQFGYQVADAGDFNRDGFADVAVISRYEEPPNAFTEPFLGGDACPGPRNNAGAVYVFLGDESGLGETPGFVYFGPEAEGRIESVAGGFDFNGDGLDDLLVGSTQWDNEADDNAGGAALIAGRDDETVDATTVICAADLEVRGRTTGDNFGFTVAGVGDVDDDGCDEVAVAAPFDDLAGVNNRGTVHVIFGYGHVDCPAAATVVVLAGAANTQAGYGLAGLVDVDGDGAHDLAVGAPGTRVGDTVGAAVVVMGSYLTSLPKERLGAIAPGTTTWPLVPLDESRNLVLLGEVHDGVFGRAVSLFEDDGTTGLAVGAPLDQLNGTFRSGGTHLFVWSDPDGLNPSLAMGIGGELGLDGFFGHTIDVAGGWLVVGGYYGSGISPEHGAAYAFPLPAAAR